MRDYNYQYGIFARINNKSSWGERQVKMYMDKNDISYKKEDKMEQLVERLKCHENKKYQS
mgnify:FL=1|jgi:hypothetical protein|tara:strand:+ start:2593 stop:2772 length:180 start_codon:yes stop_codon:yes gene_type:complete